MPAPVSGKYLRQTLTNLSLSPAVSLSSLNADSPPLALSLSRSLPQFLMQGKAAHYAPVFKQYQQKAEYFMCSCLGKGSQNVQRRPGSLLFRQRWNNMQFVTSASFLLTVYSDYLTSARRGIRCFAGSVGAPELLSFAKSQVDYLLGDNPRATNYMVGHGSNFPQQVHHRGSSIVSYKVDPTFVSCRGGYNKWFGRKASDPNLLMGAVVGRPDAYDNFAN